MKISKSFKIYIHIIIAIVFVFYQKIEASDLKNLLIHENPKKISQIKFKDFNLQDVDLADNEGKIMILNFWATWCAPCKEEMPSLNRLASILPDLMIYPIDLEKPDKEKTKIFFETLKLDNLEIFFDPEFNLAKKFKLRGVPTTVLINKRGEEFARVTGTLDFSNKKFLDFIKKYI